MSLKAVIELLAVVVMLIELRRQHIGKEGWWIVLISALFGYEMIYKTNFGILACLTVAFFTVYAWRDWFVSLGACVILMAFVENRETPRGFLGIHGMNPWNLLFFNVFCAWWMDRRRQGRVWDMPRNVIVLAMCGLFVIVWSYLRVANDYQRLEDVNTALIADNGEHARIAHYSFVWVTSEYLIDCVKWVLPGILLFDGCRTRKRVLQALGVVLALYFVIATEVINHMPISAVSASAVELAHMASRDLDHAVGYFRTEISMMLAGASWAIMSMIILVKKWRYRLILLVAAGWVALGQALTGGRAGYVTWGMVGLVLCIVRWRKMLPIIPGVILAVCLFLPAVRDRMLMGFGNTGNGEMVDEYVITSGRTLAWSYVIPMIGRSPVFGYGRQAMIRTGIYQKIIADADDPGETFPHPHNAYLELLLDDGWIGFFLMMPIYILALLQSCRMLLDRSDPLYGVVGTASASLILGLLFASIGSQSFYPKESSVGMWAAIGIMLRVYVERERLRQTGEPLFGESEAESDAEEVPEITVGEAAMPAQS